MNELLSIFVPPLNKAQFRYMVTGSVASAYFGHSRFTADVDLVLELPIGQVKRIAEMFDESCFYVPPPEVLEIEAARRNRGHFNLIHHATGMKADVFVRSADPLVDWAFDHLVNEQFGEHRVPFAPPEYVIVSKLDYYREGGSAKHLQDIRGLIAVQGGTIRLDVIESFTRSRGTSGLWHEHFSSPN